MTNPDPPLRGWQLSATVRACEAAGRAAGNAYGLAESRATLARLLRRQAKQRFGHTDAAGLELLDALASGFAGDHLEALGERLLDADSWAGWLAGSRAPPAAGYPDYAKNLEINLEPDLPSIDTLMKVGMAGGGEGVVLLRMQKWHQPDLDKILFEESLRLERLHGHRPIIGVILLWPPADAPGITGTYKGRDQAGRPATVTYSIRRAWEMLPEDALRSPGTMMLAPLSKGAKERMPEIVRKIDQGLKAGVKEERMVEAVWITTYWAMGIVCTVEEAHAALGDLLGFIHNTSDYRSAKGHCFQDGYEQATKVGSLAAARSLLLRQGNRRFGPHLQAEAVLAGLTDGPRLESLATQVLTVTDWDALLALAGTK